MSLSHGSVHLLQLFQLCRRESIRSFLAAATIKKPVTLDSCDAHFGLGRYLNAGTLNVPLQAVICRYLGQPLAHRFH